MRWVNCAALMFAATISLAASPSFAAFTTVNGPAPGEDSILQILSHSYGGTFVQTSAGSLDYTNNLGITATRLEDSSSALTNNSIIQNQDAGPVGSDDQIWMGTFSSFTAEAIFADFNQTFGYYDGASGGTYHDLLDPTGKKYNLASNVNLSTEVGLTTGDAPAEFRWARGGQDRIWSSQTSDNSDNKDHMITYRIDGLNDGFSTWLLLWEDERPNEDADFDFNDLAVQIKALPSIDVPEPAMLAPLGIGLLLSIRSRRNAKPA